MIHSRLLRAAALPLASSLLVLVGCDRIGKPTPAEEGAAKLAKVAAEARFLTQRIAPFDMTASPEAEGDDDAPASRGSMIGPAQGAEELRKLATRAKMAGEGSEQRNYGEALAQRLNREAAMLDLVALERIDARMQQVADELASNLLAAAMLRGADAIPAQAQQRVEAAQAALESHSRELEDARERTAQVVNQLKTLEDQARRTSEQADVVDAEAQLLRAEVNLSPPSAAQAKMAASTNRMRQANDLRTEAALAERTVLADRGLVRAAQVNLEITEENRQWLTQVLERSREAAQLAAARAQATARTAQDLMNSAMEAGKELQRMMVDEFQPLLEATRSAFEESNLTGKTPTDRAALAIGKARLYLLGLQNLDMGMHLAMLQGAGMESMENLFRQQREQFMTQAAAALVEARDALTGASSASAMAQLASIEALAAAAGIDLSAPPPAVPQDEQPADDATDTSMDDPSADPDAATEEDPVSSEDPANPEQPADEPDADPMDDPASDPGSDPDEPNK